MTNISKQPLPPAARQKLLYKLAALYTGGTIAKNQKLLSALLTEAEEVMLLKRYAIIVMLTERHTSYQIAQALLVSEVTVATQRSKYVAGEYKDIEIVIKKKEFDSKDFWESVFWLLRAGMPPQGKDRWHATLARLKRS